MYRRLLSMLAGLLLCGAGRADDGLLQTALQTASGNRAQLERALADAPQDQQAEIGRAHV